jgi:hypothetical protein
MEDELKKFLIVIGNLNNVSSMERVTAVLTLYKNPDLVPVGAADMKIL